MGLFLSTAWVLLRMFYPILVPFVLYFVITLGWDYRTYKGSSYGAASGNNFWKTRFDAGAYGEYLTFRVLEKCPGYKRLLANVYLPKDDGSTTEVDVAMLSEAGIYVFESKNYSGWIYGDEKSKMWTQVLNKRTKHKLFNPIWQNRGHITAMKKALADLPIDDSLYRSYIVFSERCKLQNIKVTSLDVSVVKRGSLKKDLHRDIKENLTALTRETIDRAFTVLNSHAHADDALKQSHIVEIERRHGQGMKKDPSVAPVAPKGPIAVPIVAMAAAAVSVSTDACPQCSGAVILFSGRRGDYYGCKECSYKRP